MTRKNIKLSDKSALKAANGALQAKEAEKRDNRLALMFFGAIGLFGGGYVAGMHHMEKKADAVYTEIIQTGLTTRANQALAENGLAADTEIKSLQPTRACPAERPFGVVVSTHAFGNAAQKQDKLVCTALTDSKVDVLDATCATGPCLTTAALK